MKVRKRKYVTYRLSRSSGNISKRMAHSSRTGIRLKWVQNPIERVLNQWSGIERNDKLEQIITPTIGSRRITQAPLTEVRRWREGNGRLTGTVMTEIMSRDRCSTLVDHSSSMAR